MLGVARLPGSRPEHEAVVAGLRQALGSTAFERLRVEGARLSLDEAVELALSDPPPSVPRPREMSQPAVRTRSSASPRSVTASR